MLCRIGRHKYERTEGGVTISSSVMAEAAPGTTVHVKWCYRCGKYITPPLNEKMTLDLFGEVK
jgi:hypothetical protein